MRLETLNYVPPGWVLLLGHLIPVPKRYKWVAVNVHGTIIGYKSKPEWVNLGSKYISEFHEDIGAFDEPVKSFESKSSLTEVHHE